MQIANSVINVSLRFSFTNSELVPKSIWRGGYQAKKHVDLTPGKLIIEQTPNCSGLKALEYLEREFLLVAATHGCEQHKDQTHNIVTFNFERRNLTSKNPAGTQIMRELKSLLSNQLWQVSAFENQFYMKGVLVEGKHAVNITFGKRQPLFYANGEPMLQRPKDANGKTIKEASPVPIKPAFILELTGEEEVEERLMA